MKSGSTRDALYQLVVRSELDDWYGWLFEGVQMKRATGATLLSGEVSPQAELSGFIDPVEPMGLNLLPVQRVGNGPPTSHEAKYPRAYEDLYMRDRPHVEALPRQLGSPRPSAARAGA